MDPRYVKDLEEDAKGCRSSSTPLEETPLLPICGISDKAISVAS